MANDLASRLLAAWNTSSNLRAFSHVVRQGETNQTDAAYREIYGGALADNLDDHYFRNRPHIPLPDGRTTSAFGAYQAELGTWDDFQKACGKRDMFPANQDLFFVWCVDRRHALQPIIRGDLGHAISLCHGEWTSLPGGTEQNHAYEQLVQVYQQYGGSFTSEMKVPEEQPPAPVEDRSTELPVSSPEAPEPTTTVKENSMLGGFLGNLLMSVVGSFLNPQTAQSVTSIVNKDGMQSTAAQSLLSTLLQAVAAAAGTTPAAMQSSDKTAIAATAAVQSDAAKLQSVEDAAAAHLNAVSPFIDKLAQIDQMLWDAQDRSKQTTSTVAIEEHKAGLWDMTPTMVRSLLLMLWGVAWGLLAAILFLVFKPKAEVDPTMLPVLVAIAGPIWTGAIVSTVVAMVAYRFDGTKESHAATEAQNAIQKYDDETDMKGK